MFRRANPGVQVSSLSGFGGRFLLKPTEPPVLHKVPSVWPGKPEKPSWHDHCLEQMRWGGASAWSLDFSPLAREICQLAGLDCKGSSLCLPYLNDQEESVASSVIRF